MFNNNQLIYLYVILYINIVLMIFSDSFEEVVFQSYLQKDNEHLFIIIFSFIG